MANIAILVPTLKSGGAEKQAALLARALNGHHNVTMIVPFPRSGYEDELIELSTVTQENIIPFFGAEAGSKKKLYKILREGNFDFLFCYLTWPDVWGPILGRLSGIKHIYQGIRNAELPTKKLYLEKLGNLFATGAIFNNYSGMRSLSKQGIKNCITIPNCYLNPNLSIDREGKDIITVVTVGRFVEQKDYPTAISAMATAIAKNDRLRFKIIGHGALEAEIRRMVNEAGISDKTEILINPHNILDHLKKSDIYLSTSLFEGTSNSIMEAMDASLPVVATNVGDNNLLVEDNVSGFICQVKDIPRISESILNLASSLEMRNNMGRNGNKKLRDEYSFSTFQKRYLQLIEEQFNPNM